MWWLPCSAVGVIAYIVFMIFICRGMKMMDNTPKPPTNPDAYEEWENPRKVI